MATPTLVQSSSGSSTAGNAITKYTHRLEHTTQSGNLIVVSGQIGTNGVNPTSITDDVGNTYTAVTFGANPYVTDGSQTLWVFRSFNSTAGARVFSVNMASASYITVMIQEWTNIQTSATPNDGAAGATGAAGTHLQAGAFTPSTSGDLILVFGIQSTSEVKITSWTAGTNAAFALVPGCADIFDSTACCFFVQSVAASINGDLTIAPAKNWICGAVAFKSASAGTARPAGIRIQATSHLSLTGVAANDGCSASPRTFQFPCSGNLLCLRWNSPDGAITAVTDSNSNSWTIGTVVSDLTNGNSGYNQACYAVNATTSATMTITITYSANDSSSGDTAMVSDIVGAATSPFDTYSTSHGNMTSGTTLTGGSITPTTANGLILSVLGIDSASAAGLTGTLPGVFTSTVLTPQPLTSPVDQNNGYSCELNISAITSTSVWTMSAFCKSWAQADVAFKAPASGDTLFAQIWM